MREQFAAVLAAGVVAISLLPNVASAQELSETAPELRVDAIDTRQHPAVTATITVPPEFVGQSLDATVFTITDGDGVVPATVAQLPHDALQVVLVLDTSGSMNGSPLVAAREAALSFVAAMPRGVEIAVVGFGDQPAVLSEFSTDPETATAALDQLQATGETALYDALDSAARLFPAADGARRRIVLLSDGGDTVSAATLEQAILGLLASDAGFVAVELTSPEQDAAALKRLAAASGGRVVSADDPAALDEIFQSIAADLVNQYELGFETEAFGPTTVTISVAAAGVTARATQTVRYPPPPTPVVDPAPRPVPSAVPSTAVGPEPVAAAEPTARIVVPGPLRDPMALAIGGALVFLALLIGSRSLRFSQRDVASIARRAVRKRPAKGALSGITSRATQLAEKTLNKRDGDSVGNLLEKAGVRLRSGEYIVLAGCATLTAVAIVTFLTSLLFGIAAGVVSVAVFRFVLRWKASRRRRAFADQLGDVLQMISGSIKAGYGLLQAFEAAATESLPPTSEELQRLLVETQLGRNMPEALRAMADRVGSEDFRWVVEAIEIQREVGGDLAEILQTVAATIRDRAAIRRRIHALSAEGRLSAYILIGLPFVVAGAISFTNPTYMAELTQSAVGKFMIGAGIGLMVMGAAWMRRIVRLVF